MQCPSAKVYGMILIALLLRKSLRGYDKVVEAKQVYFAPPQRATRRCKPAFWLEKGDLLFIGRFEQVFALLRLHKG